jgi:hypothetical protein
MPKNSIVVPPGTLMTTWEPAADPPDAEPHVVCTRAYAGPPPLISFAPVVPGDAECSEIYAPPPVTPEVPVRASSSPVAL